LTLIVPKKRRENRSESIPGYLPKLEFNHIGTYRAEDTRALYLKTKKTCPDKVSFNIPLKWENKNVMRRDCQSFKCNYLSYFLYRIETR
jgi:thioredoxin-related protein